MKTAIITGANGYLGLAIGQRLIDEVPGSERLRIVVTSRTFRGVIQAVKTLQAYALKRQANRQELIEFDYLLFDQCDMVSVLSAAHEINKRFEHIDWFFFNSSFSQMGGIDYVQATKDFFTRPIEAFTVGTFKIQGPAKQTKDGMGAAYEANVFAPWYLVHKIKSKLAKGGKLIWISSSISIPEFFDKNDLTIKNSHHSYEASKYSLELAHLAKYEKLLKEDGIESWLLQPGVFKSTTFVPTLNVFMYFAMFAMFYICRWMGSPYHCIYPEIAANAPAFLALRASPETCDQKIKYGSSTTRMGQEVLMETKVEPPAEDIRAVSDNIDELIKVWDDKLKDQVIERVNY